MSETIVFIDVSSLVRIYNLSGKNILDALLKEGEKIFFSNYARLELDKSSMSVTNEA